METEPTVWITLVNQLVIPILALVLTPIITSLVNRLLMMLQKKWDIELSQKQLDQIDQIVREALAYAEEQAHKAVKGDKSSMSGSEKLTIAIDYIQKKSRALNLHSLASEKSEMIAAMLEAKLFGEREDINRKRQATGNLPAVNRDQTH